MRIALRSGGLAFAVLLVVGVALLVVALLGWQATATVVDEGSPLHGAQYPFRGFAVGWSLAAALSLVAAILVWRRPAVSVVAAITAIVCVIIGTALTVHAVQSVDFWGLFGYADNYSSGFEIGAMIAVSFIPIASLTIGVFCCRAIDRDLVERLRANEDHAD